VGAVAGGAGHTGFSAGGQINASAWRTGSFGVLPQPEISATVASAHAAARAIEDNVGTAWMSGGENLVLGVSGSAAGAGDRGGDRLVDISQETQGRRLQTLKRLNAGCAERSA
jgi:hypothetical protein